MSVKVVDKLPSFSRRLSNTMDDALADAASDVLLKARRRAPFLKGGLRRDSMTKKVSNLKRRISFWIEYARFQEFGGDSRRRIRNYTSPGTGAHYLRDSGHEVAKRMVFYLAKHAKRTRP